MHHSHPAPINAAFIVNGFLGKLQEPWIGRCLFSVTLQKKFSKHSSQPAHSFADLFKPAIYARLIRCCRRTPSSTDYWLCFVHQLPKLMQLMLPISFYLGVLFALSKLYAEQEMTAIASLGYSTKPY